MTESSGPKRRPPSFVRRRFIASHSAIALGCPAFVSDATKASRDGQLLGRLSRVRITSAVALASRSDSLRDGDASMTQASVLWFARERSHSSTTFPPKLWPMAPPIVRASDRSSSARSSVTACKECGARSPRESPCSRRSTRTAPQSGRAATKRRAMPRQLARLPRIP